MPPVHDPDGSRMFMAIMGDDAALAERLLMEGFDPRRPLSTVANSTPLLWAITSGAVQVIEVLSEHGASWDPLDNGNDDPWDMLLRSAYKVPEKPMLETAWRHLPRHRTVTIRSIYGDLSPWAFGLEQRWWDLLTRLAHEQWGMEDALAAQWTASSWEELGPLHQVIQNLPLSVTTPEASLLQEGRAAADTVAALIASEVDPNGALDYTFASLGTYWTGLTPLHLLVLRYHATPTLPPQEVWQPVVTALLYEGAQLSAEVYPVPSYEVSQGSVSVAYAAPLDVLALDAFLGARSGRHALNDCLRSHEMAQIMTQTLPVAESSAHRGRL